MTADTNSSKKTGSKGFEKNHSCSLTVAFKHFHCAIIVQTRKRNPSGCNKDYNKSVSPWRPRQRRSPTHALALLFLCTYGNIVHAQTPLFYLIQTKFSRKLGSGAGLFDPGSFSGCRADVSCARLCSGQTAVWEVLLLPVGVAHHETNGNA